MSDRTGDTRFNRGLPDLWKVVQNLKVKQSYTECCPKCLQITVNEIAKNLVVTVLGLPLL